MVHDVKENGGFGEIFSEDDEVSAILESIYVELQKRLSKSVGTRTLSMLTLRSMTAKGI